MLSPSYHFHPVHNGRRPNQEANSHQDIRHIQCSGSDKLEIANVCRLPQDTILHRGDIYYGDVTVRDIIYLTEPAEITTNLLHYLLRNQFPPDHATVTLVGHELTNGILFCNWDTMYYDESSHGHILLHSLLEQIWTKQWIVFIYHKDSNHFTAPILQYHLDISIGCSTVRGHLRYVDSFHENGNNVIARICAFLDWSFQYSTVPHMTGQWRSFDGNPNPSIKQAKYLAVGRHQDEARHIDCGLYAYFSSLQTVHAGSVYGFSPEGIHYSRVMLAHQLISQDGMQPIS